jgi:hypothetical protein
MPAREAANIPILFPHDQFLSGGRAEPMQHILHGFKTLLVIEDLQGHGINIVGSPSIQPQPDSKNGLSISDLSRLVFSLTAGRLFKIMSPNSG